MVTGIEPLAPSGRGFFRFPGLTNAKITRIPEHVLLRLPEPWRVD